MDDKVKKSRSPQFPFITLQKAIERARAFEAEYHQHPARVTNAAKLWGYGEKSSGGIQTIAAVYGYGLMDDEGSLSNRKLRLTPRAMTILKDARPGSAEKAIREAALTPKVLSELFEEWGVKRPPDPECISHLTLDRAFADDAARRLLTIYDANISFANLSGSDKIKDDDEVKEELLDDTIRDMDDQSIRKPPPASEKKVPLMQNERVVFSHEIRPNQSFKLIASGEVDKEMVEAIAAFAKFQLALIAPKAGTETKDN